MSTSRSTALRTIALVAVLTFVAILVYGNQARHGGWVGDAWVTRAWYALHPHTNFFSTVGHFLELKSIEPRPANGVYRVVLNWLFGADTQAWFTLQLASCVVMCLSIYALLRELGYRFGDAAAIAGLLLLFPASAAIWFWSPIIHASLAIALGALGFILALRGFRQEPPTGRWGVALQVASLACFVLSVLLYEVCLPVFLVSILLYLGRAPRRLALLRWAVDAAVLILISVFVTSRSEARGQSLGGALTHARHLAGEVPPLFFGRLLSIDSARILAAIALLCLYATAIWLWRRRGTSPAARARLGWLLATAGAGLVVVVLGYLIYVPGIAYYDASARGIGDRVNALAAIGWVMFLYATAALLGSLAAAALRNRSWVAPATTALLLALLAISWLPDISTESNGYISATREGSRVLDIVAKAVPIPRRGSAIWTFGQPVEASPGIPVFANYWNMTGAVAMRYHDASLRSFVALPGTLFECRPEGLVPSGPEYPRSPPGQLGEFGSAYGETYFVDTVRGQFTRIDNEEQCVRARSAYELSPELPPGG